MNELRRRLIGASLAMMSVLVAGTAGYVIIGQGRWSVFDCLYMTVITLTTVGYAEVLEGFDQVPHVRTYTVALIVMGMGTFLYFASTLTATIIEGDLTRALRRTRMRQKIAKLEGHVVVCGAGSTGNQVMEELVAYGIPTVAIDLDQGVLDALAAKFSRGTIKYIVGDATDDATLDEANVDRARGVVAALANDKDNLFVVVSTRQLNPKSRLVARGSSLSVCSKLKRAGAHAVVSPNYIGGTRMVSELLRPHVVRFLDDMRSDETKMRIDEVEVPKGSPYIGCTLRDSDIRKESELLVLAARTHPDGSYDYNPGADYVIEAGMTLVVQGPLEGIQALRERARA